jgi:phospholipid/cholesterol/gamma-HCH transport system substrate-binding protein
VTGNREAVLGFVIVSAIVLTTAGTLWLQGASFGGERQTIEAVFFEAGQIMPGNAVKFRGVEVGRVGDISVEPGGDLVRVGLILQQPVVMPEDPVIILSLESLFGDWEAEIHPRVGYPYPEFPTPPDANTLPGHALPDISELTVTADRISEDLAVLVERFASAFTEETARNIASLIDNIEDVTTGLSDLVAQQAESFTEVTDGVQTATDEIATAANQVRETFEDVAGLLAGSEVESMLQDLSIASANLRELSQELGGTNEQVLQMAAQADSTFRSAQVALAALNSGEGSLGRLLQDSAMAAELENTLEELSALLEDIRENPNRYVRLSIF